MAVAAAMPDPEREPNSALPAMLVRARDPGTFPITSIARLMIRLAMPPLDIRVPARMKNGTARREKESIPVTSFWAEMNMPKDGLRNMTMVTSAEAMMPKEIGTFSASIRKNTMRRTMPACSSMGSYLSFLLVPRRARRLPAILGMLYSTIRLPQIGTPM